MVPSVIKVKKIGDIWGTVKSPVYVVNSLHKRTGDKLGKVYVEMQSSYIFIMFQISSACDTHVLRLLSVANTHNFYDYSLDINGSVSYSHPVALNHVPLSL